MGYKNAGHMDEKERIPMQYDIIPSQTRTHLSRVGPCFIYSASCRGITFVYPSQILQGFCFENVRVSLKII